jgi:hypothetical protein
VRNEELDVKANSFRIGLAVSVSLLVPITGLLGRVKVEPAYERAILIDVSNAGPAINHWLRRLGEVTHLCLPKVTQPILRVERPNVQSGAAMMGVDARTPEETVFDLPPVVPS